MDIEAKLNNTIFFPSIKNGTFDYGTPMKSILTKFDIDKTTEPSQSLFEYLCYKLVKKKALEGTLNTETVLITEKFLTTFNCKKVFIKAKAIHKKHIIIFLQNKNTLKWSLIAFLNLEEQLKNCFDERKRQPITAKIISSNANSDEDDVILNSTMDKLENTFDFKSPNDIQFEVDSINISDQPNTCIFLLNFIEGLIVQNDENISLYIKKLYDEGTNNIYLNNNSYFSSFNKISEDFENIYIKYQNELNEYFKKNKYNILNFDAEKVMNGNKEFFVIENNKENIENGEKKVLAKEKGLPEENKIVNGMENINTNLNIIRDEIDMIQLEQDDDIDADLNSEEEEEALKIMERENEEAKSIRDQERKLRQRIYKQKLRFKNMNMYKEFGIIKEEDNESESESIDLFNKLKEEKGKSLNESLKLTLKKSLEEKKNKLPKQSNNNNTKINIINNINIDNNNNIINNISENNKDIILNTDNNIIRNKNDEIKKEIIINEKNNADTKTDKEQKSKSEKSIKLSVLKDLEEALEEIELEQDAVKNNKDINDNNNNINNKSEIKISLTNENRPIEKKNSFKSENRKEDNININNNKKEKKYINVFKENIELKKRNSFSKNKEKEFNLEDKKIQNRNIEKLKKTLTNIKKNEKDKEKQKEKKVEEGLNKYLKANSLTQKKILLKENIFKNNKSNNLNNLNKLKDQDNNINSNNTTKIYITNIFNSNSSISNNERDKSPNIKEKENNINKKELNENIIKKNNTNNNYKNNNNNFSKNKNNQIIKKTNSKKFSEKQSQSTLYSKLSNNSQKSSSTNKTSDSFSKSSEDKNILKNKKKPIKEIEIKIEKNKNKDVIAIDNPLKALPPQKNIEKNGYFDLSEKDKIENGSSSNSLKVSNFNDMNSVKSDRNNGDYSSNINIENIFSDDFESEKDKYEKFEIKDEGSFLGENRTKKISMVRKVDKRLNKKRPPGKPQTSTRNYNDYCNYDEEGANKICGCIGEQSNGICFIF